MILSRLKNAIREQNWFAVVLEIIIVVLGVVIGFQITAWGNDRADRSMEQMYLHQLASDLETTQAHLAQLDAALAPSDRAAERLFQSFREVDTLPTDSILVLISEAAVVNQARPVLAIIEALIATGDLSLVRDDSLRIAIPAYLEKQLMMIEIEDVARGSAWKALEDLIGFVDLTEANAIRVAHGGILSVRGPGVVAPDSVAEGVHPFPFDAARFRSNREAYDAVWRVDHMKIQSRWIRGSMAELARELHERVETELNR